MKKINLINYLVAHSEEDGVITFYQSTEKKQKLSYQKLYEQAGRVCSVLQLMNLKIGQKVLMQLQDEQKFLIVFWACLMGKFVPVPLSCGRGQDTIEKLLGVYNQLDGAVLITTETQLKYIEKRIGDDHLLCRQATLFESLFVDVGVDEGEPDLPVIKENDIAFIQYSSGSTGAPKGVVLTHKNIISNIKAIGKAIGYHPSEKTISWLPLTHDMGLIGFHLVPLLHGWSQVLIDTNTFIRRPMVWLDAISETRATLTVSPNFGLKHVLKHLDRTKNRNLDLSSIRLIFNGAEPVNRSVCATFTEQFALQGLQPNVMFPVYGMAEASLAVTFAKPGHSLVSRCFARNSLNIGQIVQLDPDGIELVELGEPISDCQVKLVDEQGIACNDCQVGHILIKGKNVTQGYYICEESEVFTDDGWLKTGDIGFMDQGRLTLTGRSKEIIIINGVNYYPYDLEQIAGSLPNMVQMAFVGCKDASKIDEQVVCFVRFKGANEKFVKLKQALELHMATAVGIELGAVIPVSKLPKTSSGKVCRAQLKKAFECGQFDTATTTIESKNPLKQTTEQVLDVLIPLFKQVLNYQKLSIDHNFFDLGGTSIEAVAIKTRLAQVYGNRIDESTLFKYPTLRKLASHICGDIDAELTAVNEASKVELKKAGLNNKTNASTTRDIAIIGMSGRFPGANDVEAFWHNLCEGVDSISQFSKKELLEAGISESLLNDPHYVCSKGIIENADAFDASFFEYPPVEARKLEPQIRILHECAWTALENAGYDSLTFSGKIGCYVGASPNDAWSSSWRQSNSEAAKFSDTLLIDKDFISTRLSYKLNLTGPSVNIYTACSTSLVTVEMACQSLLNGQCDMALAGGVSVSLPLKSGYLYEPGMLFAKQGENRSFDKDASGSVFSDGAGLVLLKPLDRAIADKDNILAVIKGIATNNDGNDKVGYTAPSVHGQAQVIIQAQQLAGVTPEDISYVEAHGSATRIGDVIEVEALNHAMKGASRCALGSVKSNVGHMNSAAGIGGLIKVVNMLQHAQLPPSLHYEQANSGINFDQSPFYVNTQLCDWIADKPLCAGVSSFGIGGTNVHAILQQAPALCRPKQIQQPKSLIQSKKSTLFLLSAKTDISLTTRMTQLHNYLSENKSANIADIAYTLQVGRHHFTHRLFFVCADVDEAIDFLSGQLSCERAQVVEGVGFIGVNAEIGLTKLGSLWLQGKQIDWRVLKLQGDCYRVILPTYPFAKDKFHLGLDRSISKGDEHYHCYIPTKTEAPIVTKSSVDLSCGVLIIDDNTGLAQALKKAFYHLSIPVFVHQSGTQDYVQLLEMLTKNGKLPSVVLHLAHLRSTQEKLVTETFNQAYLDISDLLISLLRQLDTQKCYVRVLTNAQSMVEKSAVSGPLNVIYGESGNLHGSTMTVTWEPECDVPEDILVNQIVTEVSTEISLEAIDIVLASGKRYVEGVKPLIISSSDISDYEISEFKPGGVYLITGGLGGIGFTLASHLATSVQAKLLLIGRRELGDRTSQVDQLESLGGHVRYFSADVANLADMHNVFEEAFATYGKIDGVIHTAGIVDGGLLINRKVEDDLDVYHAKVDGTMVLASLLSEYSCDFLLLCASIASVIPVPGQSAYISANRFLNWFAHNHSLDCKVRTIDWDRWLSLPYSSFSKKNITCLLGEEVETGLTVKQGISAFERVLQLKHPQVVISAIEIQARKRQMAGLSDSVGFVPVTLRPRPNLNITYVEPQTPDEQKMVGLFEQYSGIEKVGIYDNFFELGITSLDLIQMNRQLSEQLNRSLSLTSFYANPTIYSFVRYLERESDAVLAPQISPKRVNTGNRDIAIIGMAGRFPGAENVQEFWHNLTEGIDSIRFFSDEELLAEGIDPELVADNNFIQAKGYAADFDCFDYEFFGFSPREVQIMSPQMRLTFESVWQAMEDAGYPPGSHQESVGLYFGASHNIAWENQLKQSSQEQILGEFESTLLSHKEFISTRVAYKLNLNGPSVYTFTGCSTSLVTVHQACQSLLAGECDMAVAGGVSVELPLKSGYRYQDGMIFSRDGYCRSFDQKASGSSFGDGIGAVLLKPLDAALNDGDNIVAVIKGSAINNDGSAKVGYPAPSVSGQASVISKAHLVANIDSSSIGYIEAHGSATPVGDPIELEALKSAFNCQIKQFCHIGSVKSNIGHLNTASGIAGLIKTAMVVKNGEIPASLHVDKPTTKFDFSNSPFKVCQQLTPWPSNFDTRRAGISSFGIGGTNVHMILQQAPQLPTSQNNAPQLLVLSAKTEAALQLSCQNMLGFMKSNPYTNIADIAYTLQLGRVVFEYCRVVIVKDINEAIIRLQQPQSEWSAIGKNLIIGDEPRVIVYVDEFNELLEQYHRLTDIKIVAEKCMGQQRRRLSLPTYPFARLKCSLDNNQTSQNIVTDDKKNPVSEWFYQSTWVICELPWSMLTDPIMLLTENSQQTDTLLSQLGDAPVVDKLLDAQHIVYLFPQTDDWTSQMYNLVKLLQQIDKIENRAQLRLTLISQNLYNINSNDINKNCADQNTAADPIAALLVGFALSVNQEYQDISCHVLDFDSNELAQTNNKGIIKALQSMGEDIVYVWRDEQCWRQEWSMFEEKESLIGLRPGGVYLITGGFGKVGLELAKGLVNQYNAKLVLVGRRGCVDESQIKALGANVLCFAASVADEIQMSEVFAEVERQWGSINGVIHCAGWADEDSICPVVDMTPAFIAQHAEAKVLGTVVLEKLLYHRQMDFCLLMSSLSSMLGGLGLGAYAGVNQFMDCFVAKRSVVQSGTRWLSVNWDLWLQPQAQQHDYFRKVMGQYGMQPEQGFEVFKYLINHVTPSQVAISTGDLDIRLSKWSKLKPSGVKFGFSKKLSRDKLTTPYAAPTSSIQKQLVEVFSEHFGFDNLSIYDNFFDFGVTSVDLLQLHQKVDHQLNAKIPLAKFLTYTTIYALAGYLTGDGHRNGTSDVKSSKSSSLPVAQLTVDKTVVGDQNDVAIIGMAAQFPGADNIDQFWQNLKGGVESIIHFKKDELLKAGVPENLIDNPDYVASRGLLEHSLSFDAMFFGYSPKEAEAMDPQSRVLHECTWHALEHAGYNPYDYDGKIGFYAGGGPHPYWEHLSTPAVVKTGKPSEQYAKVQLYEKDFSPTRIAYKLNLKGTTLSVFTACSTALVAVHLASASVVKGECDMALAGGVSVWLPQKIGYLHEPGMILSADGHNRSFDAEASGSVFSDGVGVVLLKKLSRAIADGDTIHAVIKGTAINNDGNRKLGYTAPSVEGQVDVIRSAMAAANVSVQDISYIETHGSATSLGDVIEVEALNVVFSNTGANKGCILGAVKSNIGHTNSAAGAAGLIKTVMALEHGLLPPTLHLAALNPCIGFEHTPFTINTELQSWSVPGDVKTAGVSSFGIGGTNAHVVVQQAPSMLPGSPSTGPWLLILSAKTEVALNKNCENLAQFLIQEPTVNMADVAYTLQVGRKGFVHRKILVCSSSQDASEQLSSTVSGRVLTAVCRELKRDVVFMFPGQGGQYINMGRELYACEPIFTQNMDLCFAHYQKLTGLDIKNVLYPEHSEFGTLNDTAVSQPLLFMFEYALSRMMLSKGIVPTLMVGYSFGEYTAACVAGVFSVFEALDLIHIRGQLMQSLPEGRMISISLDKDKLLPLLTGSLAIAIENPDSCIVGGLKADIEGLQKQLKQQRCFVFAVDVTHFAHSPLLQPIVNKFKLALDQIDLQPPQIPYISNVTGQVIEPQQAISSDYWCQHLLQTVQFDTCLETLIASTEGIMVEVGPGHDLSVMLRSKLNSDAKQQLVNLVSNKNERVDSYQYLLEKLGQLWLFGGVDDWAASYQGQRRLRVPLPLYVFDRQEFNIPKVERNDLPVLSNDKSETIDDWFYLSTWQRARLPNNIVCDSDETMRVLLFVDDFLIGDRLAIQLENNGEFVVQVKQGNGFEEIDSQHFVVNPASPQNYQQLMDAMPTLESVELKVCHLWTVTGDINQYTVKQGYYSILYLSRVLANHSGISKLQWLICSDRVHQIAAEPMVQPEKALLLAFPLVLPQEHPHINCRHIDIMLPGESTHRQQILTDQLLRELSHETRGEPVIAYRGHHRWIQSYEIMPLVLPETSRIKPLGIYLITGGLGGVGLILAEYLAKQYQAKLVLISRHPCANKIMQLNSMNVDFITIAADCSDVDQMSNAIEQAEQHYGSLDGVIHAAGLVGREWLAPVVDAAPAICEPQWQPKIEGVKTLQKVLADKKLDFVLCMSSISNVLGGLGHVAYIAGNLYMDAFTREQNQLSDTQWISVNWDGWQTDIVHTAENDVAVTQDKFSMTPAQSVEAFERVLCCHDVDVLVHSTGDLNTRLNQWVKLSTLEKSSDKAYPRPALSTPMVAPETALDKILCDIMQKHLGVEEISIYDNFFDLNADSFLLVQVINMIRQKLEQDISVITLYKYPTVSQLSAFMVQIGVDADKPI